MSRYMHCIASSVRQIPIRLGTYSLVVAVDGTAPRRQATIIDGWGGLQCVKERENGHWRLVREDTDAFAEFVPA